jgi:hypothetical protein
MPARDQHHLPVASQLQPAPHTPEQAATHELNDHNATINGYQAPESVDRGLGNRRVWIPGGPKTDPRWGELTEWGVQILDRRTKASRATDAPIIYSGVGSPESRQASGCAAISETLRRAGLANEADIRPASVAG